MVVGDASDGTKLSLAAGASAADAVPAEGLRLLALVSAVSVGAGDAAAGLEALLLEAPSLLPSLTEGEGGGEQALHVALCVLQRAALLHGHCELLRGALAGATVCLEMQFVSAEENRLVREWWALLEGLIEVDLC